MTTAPESDESASPAICADCARLERACCLVPAGERLTTLTLTDVRRIEEATGWPEPRFAERERLTDDERARYEQARPLYRGLFAGGRRTGLKSVGGACALLNRAVGCLLPERARPLACRLYPFDFDAAGRLTLVDAPDCLALERSRGPADLMRLLSTSRGDLDQLRRQILAEVAQHARAARRCET